MPRGTDAARTDHELVAACLRGEQAAWDGLIDRYAALIYSIALNYGLGEADAADVFQSVCLILLNKLGSVRQPRALAAWITTTTTRECVVVARGRQRDNGQLLDDTSALAAREIVDTQQLPEEEVLSLERQHLVRTAVNQLPGKCRRLVEALFSDPSATSAESTERMSYEQLADSLAMPTNSLGPTRGRCLEKLRRLLEAAGYTP